jgi:hypothetical protein
MGDAFEIISMEEYRRRVLFLQDIIREEALAEARAKGERQGLKRGEAKGLVRGQTRGLKQGLQQGLQQGLENGLERGLNEGREEGLRTALLIQWPLRFGRAAGPRIRARLDRADFTTLKRWTQHLLTAKRPADVFR